MNLDDDQESVFERALRADLPSMSEQERLRKRILAAGIAAGTLLGGTNLAAASQASFGASALSKLSALSWPVKLGLAAVVAAPVAALPLVYAPVGAAAMVAQVRSSAATVRARAGTKAAPAAAQGLPLEAPSLAREPEPEPEQPNHAVRAPGVAVSNSQPPPAPSPSAPAIGSAVGAEPAVAAFDSLPHDAAASESLALQNSSTLAAETHLLDRAFAALAAGDRSTAAALIAEHTRRFPNGRLRQERERARARLAADPKGE